MNFMIDWVMGAKAYSKNNETPGNWCAWEVETM